MSYYIGLLSGTSVDGIDAAIVKIDINGINLIETYEQEFSVELKDQVQSIIKTQNITLQELSDVDVKLANEFCSTIENLLNKSKLTSNDIVAIGSHGQTIYHQPQSSYRNTIQIGSPHILAAKTGINVVGHFRNLDMAFKGQGAPLAPLVHAQLYADQSSNTVVVNLGGIANISFVGKNFPQAIGYDIGPANCLLDEWINLHQGQAYDNNGQWAQLGQLHQGLLDILLADAYFEAPHPKSTGREYFNLKWLNAALTKTEHVNAQDIQTTLVHLTAQTIATAIMKETHTIDKICLVGGGAHNTFLKSLIADKTSITTDKADNSDWVEAILFAYLAERRINQHKLDLSSFTGSSTKILVGDIIRVKSD